MVSFNNSSICSHIGLTLVMSALEFFRVTNLHYQFSGQHQIILYHPPLMQYQSVSFETFLINTQRYILYLLPPPPLHLRTISFLFSFILPVIICQIKQTLNNVSQSCDTDPTCRIKTLRLLVVSYT